MLFTKMDKASEWVQDQFCETFSLCNMFLVGHNEIELDTYAKHRRAWKKIED